MHTARWLNYPSSVPDRPSPLSLPIDDFLPDIVAALGERPNLVLVAEPGAGKTTRLPAALLGAGFLAKKSVLVLEPRRLAARMAARRIASELGEEVGARVGYVVRFERVVSPRTQVVFLTEALLTRRLVDDPTLSDVGCVVLDEFHERSLHTDLGLALLARLQRTTRPDLRIVVMSATLDAERVAAHLDAQVVRVPGRTFPVDVTHLERPDDRRLDEQVAAAVRRLCVQKCDGDVLAFLPGAAEIRRAEEACTAVTKSFGLDIALLHGDLPAAQQDRAVTRGPRPKLVLSTNIAETSLTLEGVVAVIDSGLARVAGHSAWSGMSTLGTQKISQASAIQRTGRAGRVRAGSCVRLYTKADFDNRARFDLPELLRADLCEIELTLRVMFGGEPDLTWLEPPPSASRAHAIELLSLLGCIDGAGAPTARGRAILGLPVHPRAARLALALAERGFPDEGATFAALLGERDIRLGQRAQFGGGRRERDEVGESDLLARADALDALGSDLSADRLRRHELDPGAVRAVVRTRDQLARPLRRVARVLDEPFEQALHVSTLLAYPDRVGKRRTKHGAEIVLSRGGSATLSPASVVKEAELVVAVEADERGRGDVIVHSASAIEPEWLLEHFPDLVRSEEKLVFNPQTERVEQIAQLLYGAVSLDESRRPAEPSAEVARLLAEAALSRGPSAPWDVEAVDMLARRLRFVASASSVPAFDEAALREAVIAHAADKNSFEALRADPLEHALLHRLDPSLRHRLEQAAPSRIRLPSGRELTVHYELDRPPWVASRLQDFFGMLDGPRLGDAQVPLVIHLLAPSQRPVQVTTDLKGFWDRHYPGIRKELMRRYPRHSWPEDPRTAEPPARRR